MINVGAIAAVSISMSNRRRRREAERREAENRKKRQRQLQEDPKAKRRANNARASFSHEYSYIDCVMKEIALEVERAQGEAIENEGKITLIRLCEEFNEMYKKVLLEDVELLREDARQIQTQIDQETRKQLNIQEKLGDKFDTIEKLDLSVFVLEHEEMFANSFRQKHSRLSENGKEKILLKEIKKLERKIKYLPFGKKTNQVLLTEKQKQLGEIEKAKLQVEEFESLSTQDKKEMLEYLRSRDESTVLAKRLEDKRYEIAAETAFGSRPGCGRNFEKTQERIKIALGRMLSEGKISDKGLEDIYRTLDKVGLKARRGEYDFKSRPSATDGKVGIYKEFMKWFIENVYEEDEKFIKRNTGVEEGEQELS